MPFRLSLEVNQYDIRICVLLYRLHHCGGLVVKIQHTWPFPFECPPKPWTPEQQREYDQQQRAKVPDAPMIVSFV